MISGTAYGVVLNDRDELSALRATFLKAPYKAAPIAPVVYIKPRNCFNFGGAPVLIEDDIAEVSLASTLAVLFARDVTDASPDHALEAVGAMCLALDVRCAREDYYRPAIAQTCRDGFLALGDFAPVTALPKEIVTHVDERMVHVWQLSRLVRPLGQLIADLSSFMTLSAGDLLLAGLPGDAPSARIGQNVRVSAAGLAPLATRLKAA